MIQLLYHLLSFIDYFVVFYYNFIFFLGTFGFELNEAQIYLRSLSFEYLSILPQICSSLLSFGASETVMSELTNLMNLMVKSHSFRQNLIRFYENFELKFVKPISLKLEVHLSFKSLECVLSSFFKSLSLFLKIKFLAFFCRHVLFL